LTKKDFKEILFRLDKMEKLNETVQKEKITESVQQAVK
jgi:hypothetical protein